MRKPYKVKKAVLNKVELVNGMLPHIKELDTIPSSYGGTTHAFYVELDKPIEIKNQFIYLNASNCFGHGIGCDTRYNLKHDTEEINYYLGIIIKAFRKSLKECLNESELSLIKIK
jgi:hypothetical protein